MKRPDELSHVETAILGVLQDHVRGLHGVAISEEVDTRSEGYFSLPFGTLYPALKRLEGKGFISGTWESLDEAAQAGRPRRCTYRITAAGAAALTEAARLHAIRAKFLPAV